MATSKRKASAKPGTARRVTKAPRSRSAAKPKTPVRASPQANALAVAPRDPESQLAALLDEARRALFERDHKTAYRTAMSAWRLAEQGTELELELGARARRFVAAVLRARGRDEDLEQAVTILDRGLRSTDAGRKPHRPPAKLRDDLAPAVRALVEKLNADRATRTIAEERPAVADPAFVPVHVHYWLDLGRTLAQRQDPDASRCFEQTARADAPPILMARGDLEHARLRVTQYGNGDNYVGRMLASARDGGQRTLGAGHAFVDGVVLYDLSIGGRAASYLAPAVLDRAARAAADDAGSSKATAAFEAGVAKLRSHELDAAVEELWNAVRLAPTNRGIRHLLAAALYGTGRYEEAEQAEEAASNQG